MVKVETTPAVFFRLSVSFYLSLLSLSSGDLSPAPLGSFSPARPRLSFYLQTTWRDDRLFVRKKKKKIKKINKSFRETIVFFVHTARIIILS